MVNVVSISAGLVRSIWSTSGSVWVSSVNPLNSVNSANSVNTDNSVKPSQLSQTWSKKVILGQVLVKAVNPVNARLGKL
ncbi:hypothetical protein Hanom_Chr10g00908031 [Helianthus anomalus]